MTRYSVESEKKEGVQVQDYEIVALYFERNEFAIIATAEKYGKYLSKIAFNITNDAMDSEESVNDTYLAAWNSMPPHKPGVLKTFLSKLTRRISIDRVRMSSRKKRYASQYALSLNELEGCISESSPDDTLDAKLLGEAISTYLRTVTPDARNAFILRYYYLDSLRETAAILDMSESKLKSLLHRTRISLKEYLKKEGFDV